jgi:hypothetical protein
MAIFSLTSRILLVLSVVTGPLVCCCTPATADEVFDGGPMQTQAMSVPDRQGSCHGQPAPSDVPAPQSDKNHTPRSCPDCSGPVISIDNTPGTATIGYNPTFTDPFSFPPPPQLAGELNPSAPRPNLVAKPQAAFSGDSLHALLRLLTI